MGDKTDKLNVTVREVLESISEDASAMRRPPSGHVVLNWLQVAMIIGTVVASAAVGWYRLNDAVGLLHEVKGAQKLDSDEVIKLREALNSIASELDRVRSNAVTQEGLEVERVSREALEKRFADRVAQLNTEVALNTARVGTLRAKHNSKE